MSVRLSIGDAVLVYNNKSGKNTRNRNSDNDDDDDDDDCSDNNIQIGVIKYIGYIDGYDMKEYIGIELVKSVDNGHNGTINGYQYFQCPDGHGIDIEITNIIRKLKASEIVIKMQQIITLLTSRLDEYVQALSERDEYIETLKNESTSNDISKNTISIKPAPPKPEPIDINGGHQMKANHRHKTGSEFAPYIDFPITPITPTESEGDEGYDSNATIIYHNIDKKSCTFKAYTSSNKTSSQIKDNDNKKNKKRKSSLRNGSNLFSIYSEYTKYSDLESKKKRNDTSTSIETQQSSDDESTNTEWTDDDDDDVEYDSSDNDDDDDDIDNINNINTYSPYLRVSGISTITPITPITPYSNNKSPKFYQSYNDDMLPPNQPQQQQYAYSHETYDELQKQERSNNMNHMRLPMPSLQHLINSPQTSTSPIPSLIQSYTDSPPMAMASPTNNNNYGYQEIQQIKSMPDLHRIRPKSTGSKPVRSKPVRPKPITTRPKSTRAKSVKPTINSTQCTSWNPVIINNNNGALFIPNLDQQIAQYAQKGNIWNNRNNQQQETQHYHLKYSASNNNQHHAVNNNPYYH